MACERSTFTFLFLVCKIDQFYYVAASSVVLHPRLFCYCLLLSLSLLTFIVAGKSNTEDPVQLGFWLQRKQPLHCQPSQQPTGCVMFMYDWGRVREQRFLPHSLTCSFLLLPFLEESITEEEVKGVKGCRNGGNVECDLRFGERCVWPICLTLFKLNSVTEVPETTS